jgi:hypothetical protein
MPKRASAAATFSSNASRDGIGSLWSLAQAEIWLSSGRDAKYASESAAGACVTGPSIRTCRLSGSQWKINEARGFASSSLALGLRWLV